MNGLCSACGQPVEVVDFRLDEGFVLVRCTACKKEQRLSLSEATGATGPAPAERLRAVAPPAAAPARPAPVQPAGPLFIAPAFSVPAGFCPKCVAPRAPESKSCPSCGLVFANTAVDSALKPSEALAASWTALAARWAEAAEHVRFLRQAADGGELAAAGHLYRIRLALQPGDAVARSSLEAAVKLASAPMSVAAVRTAPGPAGFSRRTKAVAVAAVLLLAPTLAFALLRLLGGR